MSAAGKGRGGARPGAGRPPGPRTTVVRLPVGLATLARRLKRGSYTAGDVNAFMDLGSRSMVTVPLMGSTAACGFPSPADDYTERPLDFNELLVRNAASTFAVRIAGDSMTGIGMFPNDVAVVDRSRQTFRNSVVLGLLDGGFTIKTLTRHDGRVYLEPANPAYPVIPVTEDTDFEVWGIVTHCIRMLA